MSYSAEISRGNPSCLLFLVDQSGSMDDPFGGDAEGRRKADGVADALNRLLQNIVIKCAKSEGVRDYYDVGVIGYGASTGPALGGAAEGRLLVPISEVANSPVRIEERQRKIDDGAGGLVDQTVKFPIWLDAVAQGGTPMCRALGEAEACIAEWTKGHAGSFPPIVINITDGESTDGDPAGAAEKLRAQATNDGNALLFNVHLSSHRAPAIEFPSSEEGLPDAFARLLFNMSSPLPPHMLDAAQGEGYTVSDGARGFVFNGDIVSVIRFLDIGTRPGNLR